MSQVSLQLPSRVVLHVTRHVALPSMHGSLCPYISRSLHLPSPRRPLAVSTVPVAVAAGGGASAGEPLTFERLLINGGLPAAFIEAAAAQRARINYGHVVTLALLERNPAVALGAYEMAKRLPSTATVKVLHSKGYKLGGLLCQGSELVVCYKRLRVYLLKSLREDEAARVRIFHDAFAGTPVPHVTPYELVDTPGGKHFMIMPKFATALEPVSYLDPAGVAAIWAHMEEALGCLHAKGFAHADVKPANICVREDGLSFFLIDLGSVAQLGARTSSTLACVPRNIARGRASAELDWWMLAVTLAEKACGADHVLEVGRGHRASTAELRAHLAAHLSAAVWAALEPKLVG